MWVSHENDEDNFSDITGITDILSKWHVMKITKSGLTITSNAYNLSTITGVLINWTKSVYLTITCYCSTTHEQIMLKNMT